MYVPLVRRDDMLARDWWRQAVVGTMQRELTRDRQ
jgi:hypothetical protein